MEEICGGIDIGGTKIRACLFDSGLNRLADHEIATPVETYPAFFEAVTAQITWLYDRAGRADVPVGLCLPGLVDRTTGAVFAANIPITSQDLAADLRAHFGQSFLLAHDAVAFAFSEAQDLTERVVGLVLGTGVGAGFCPPGTGPEAGIAIEIGQIGVPARLIEDHALPLWPSSGPRRGCLERYMSGAALAEIATWRRGAKERRGRVIESPDVVAAADRGDAVMQSALDIWLDALSEGIACLHLMLAPDVIVLGGGAAEIPRLTDRLASRLAARRLAPGPAIEIRIAAHGAPSAARGMARAARDRRT